MTQTNNSKKALVLTVGTGNVDDIERTLLVPVLKSVEDGKWERVVLLPSLITEDAARILKERISSSAVELKSLPELNQENDADSCFGHFDDVLAGLIDDGFEPNDIQVDFTRGTKAMSAALVLAAVGRGIQVLRYVYSEQRDERGMVVPDTEKVGQVRTSRATTRRLLDQAKEFMRQGDFSAVISLLPAPERPFFDLRIPEVFRPECTALRAAAQIYAAWDRLAYKAAAQVLAQIGPPAAKAGSFALTPEMRKWLHCLMEMPEQNDHKAMAIYLRRLAGDLLANAERRIRDSHLEDALLRAYRVLELIGQIRLFNRGYNSSALPPDDETIQAVRKKLKKKKSKDFDPDNKTGKLTASRLQVARLLKELGDPFGQKLSNFDKEYQELQVRHRNDSVLVHGFTATAPPTKESLCDVLCDLEKLLIEDDPKATERLSVARSLSFSDN